MKLLDFFYQESNAPKAQILFLAIVSGIANGVLLMVINNAAESVNKGEEIQVQYFILFIVDLLLYFYTKKYSLTQATIAAEEAIERVRIRVADKLRHTELGFIESSGHSEIFTRITQDTSLISESATVLINAAQQLIVVLICLLYILWLSTPGFIVTIVILGFSVVMYLYNAKNIGLKLHDAVHKEAEFFDGIKQILLGFKEIKINQKKNNALFARIETVAQQSKALKLETGMHFVIEMMFAQTSFYILCASIVFALPVISPTYVSDVVQITIAILFLFGPLSMVVSAAPMFARANVSVENIYQLEQEIDDYADQYARETAQEPQFSSIEFKQVMFTYQKQAYGNAFSVGPIDLKLSQGEIVFIVGGNGSGKSTLLKLLTGLYYPTSGAIMFNGKLLEKNSYLHYRELFSTIFTDFYLFDRLYGVQDTAEEQVQALIKRMGLESKTSFTQGRFSNVDLSTGQRKRLAYISADLEDKQIYIFDEWAADQDPEFREYFYQVLLKELKQKGKTVIAVSHDERYFSSADRVIKMEYGRIIEINKAD
ncbi:MAG: cyclic peptide export ABC transporter [Methylococcaceae bacterium]|nr:cyclic peptide export ABC transporter [Methylococcaceae bacterium]